MEILQSNTQEKYRREREEFKRAFSELQQRMKSDARILGEIIQLKERLVHLEGVLIQLSDKQLSQQN